MRSVLLIALPLSVALVFSCSSTETSTPAAEPSIDGGSDAAPASPSATTIDVLAVIDLPRLASTQSLSGTHWDESTRTLHAVQDKTETIVPIVVPESFTSISVGKPLALTGRPQAIWDGEGITRIGDELFVVTHETTPLIERFDMKGAFLGSVDVPAHFADQAGGNKGIESLTSSPDGAFLFFANEAALTSDGDVATKTKGTTVRILRRELATSTDVEKKYVTEPLGKGGATGDMGVSELAALSDRSLLVLERGYQPGYGNTVRIFRVDFAQDADMLTKSLVVDLATLPSDGIEHPSTQPNPILDNYEALAIGPTLDDGRITLFVTSDDNGSATQVARILVLAIPKE